MSDDGHTRTWSPSRGLQTPRRLVQQQASAAPGGVRSLSGRHAARLALVSVLGLVAAFAGGASAGTNGKPAASDVATAKVGEVLTIATTLGPNSLDPAKNGACCSWFTSLAYEPLIYLKADGTLAPGLAVKWGYRRSGNRYFQVTLRDGVKFSDGTPLTAAIVKKWLLYFKSANGPNAQLAANIAAVNTAGRRVVSIILSKPDPELPKALSQIWLMGSVASGAAVDNPSQLSTRTAGAGPYMLDSSRTVANDHYTYIRNPGYWNKAAPAHYKKIVIKVIQNPSALLQAMRAGQVDVAPGDITTADAAAGAGLKVFHRVGNVVGLALVDRSGKLAPPLGKLSVRQAINYAIDRRAIATALFRKYGTPTSQIFNPDLDGYDPTLERYYPYNPAKARQLLATAGYPDGFRLQILSINVSNIDLVTQAVASYLDKVGIKVEIKSTTVPQYVSDGLLGAKYPAISFSFGLESVHSKGTSMFLPNALLNPFHSEDQVIQRLYDRGAQEGSKKRAATYRALARRITSLAWFAPVSYVHRFYYARKSVAGVRIGRSALGLADPLEWRPAG
jgi:peptide/nickel transport system substrate-binding protein